MDSDPSSGRVSVTLTAATRELEIVPGKLSRVGAYSGSLPGPLIRAKRGDQLSVHFENELSEPTSVHFHGVRVPNLMDGVPDMTQPAVAPGGSFEYAFDLPDAGLYWYHPHSNSVAELGSGLYGPILVEDPDEPSDLGDETVLVLSDMSVDEDGVLVPPSTDASAIIAGSEGNVVLVNGMQHPRLEVAQGRRQRFRVLNAARSRYFKLGLAGTSFLEIGTDGGRLEQPSSVAEPVLAPGERLDLLFEPVGAVGSSLELVARPVARGLPLPASQETALVTLAIVPGTPSPPLPNLGQSLAALDTSQAEAVSIELTVNEGASSVTMGVDDVPSEEADPVHAHVGQTQILVVENQSPYNHPFHLHGFFFQPLDAAGAPIPPLSRKDTIDIPPLAVVKLAVSYDDRPGMWMFHCHILDHAEAGMMGMLHVMP